MNRRSNDLVTSKSGGAITSVACDRVHAVAAVAAGAAQTIVDVGLTPVASEPDRTSTPEAVDQVLAYSVVQTRVDLAFVDVYFALSPGKT